MGLNEIINYSMAKSARTRVRARARVRATMTKAVVDLELWVSSHIT